jgi:excisionase family DNA binding protein
MPLTETMTTRDAAKRLGCSQRTIHRRVRDGQLIPLMQVDQGINGPFLFTAAEVERFAATQGKALNGAGKAAS